MDPAVAFRPMTEADFGVLVQWFADPDVVQWFGPPKDRAAVDAKYGPRLRGEEPTEMWILEIDGNPAGMLQCYRHVDHPETDEVVGVADAAGIDYLLAAPVRGRGLAGGVLSSFAHHALARFPDCRVVVATPNENNAASCGALRAAGFRLSHTSFPASGEREPVYVLTPT